MAPKNKFSTQTKLKIFLECGLYCANPTCRKKLTFYDEATNETVPLGQVCHIYPASAGGPRFDETHSTPEELKSPENGICLCRGCHTMVDDNPKHYTAIMLQSWKEQAKRSSPPVTMANVKELARYIKDKKPHVRELDICLSDVKGRSCFSFLPLDLKMKNVVLELAGATLNADVYEFTDSRIRDEVQLFSAMATVVGKHIFLENTVQGGAFISKDSLKPDFFGGLHGTTVFNDELMEMFNQLTLVFRGMETLLAESEEITLTR
ncbi:MULTISPECIES: HNH endonuclease signature motif containing protein [Enterobacteriaceae]|uniref:HNH endonuclease signature motif containing protein n=1 Tax=Enterobacteriaceae TaxID=543 RepID=UPI00226B5178|nr:MULTISPECIES: HNH endonuclease signature motif containing protein [Enterobacteriaceae]MCX9044106.1 HNH endonuclease [Citrobacter portucalensis]MDA8491324.1 HNH endonuclease [Kluyvera sp. Awk 3]